jgi:hypothetical protein
MILSIDILDAVQRSSFFKLQYFGSAASFAIEPKGVRWFTFLSHLKHNQFPKRCGLNKLGTMDISKTSVERPIKYVLIINSYLHATQLETG